MLFIFETFSVMPYFICFYIFIMRYFKCRDNIQTSIAPCTCHPVLLNVNMFALAMFFVFFFLILKPGLHYRYSPLCLAVSLSLCGNHALEFTVYHLHSWLCTLLCTHVSLKNMIFFHINFIEMGANCIIF